MLLVCVSTFEYVAPSMAPTILLAKAACTHHLDGNLHWQLPCNLIGTLSCWKSMETFGCLLIACSLHRWLRLMSWTRRAPEMASSVASCTT